MIIPGPKEPSLEQLNHALEPLIADFKMIYAGCRKTAGFTGHSHKIHPCNICLTKLEDLQTETAYDITSMYSVSHYFEFCNDFIQLRNANSLKMARSQAARKWILDATGAQYSCLRAPRLNTVHCSPLNRGAAGWRVFQDTINGIIWPSGIGCLPNNMCENNSLQKADQWQRLTNIQTTTFWFIHLPKNADDDEKELV
ncbi:hypothetical protein DEU56DRAFT_752867 [Suillus clintonianus]|uniref:uncharacterized protein n=1 Tax=Suillus clintonianus TaxID=1904413 RepID=UPI001B860290|nr:uncharacterized protein DEU56DRAFT_752867 [Suillus clintonianus]KAG2149215.1 hypothetical protein DEU56DRAFT_752867 [Suillus clintonianus]